MLRKLKYILILLFHVIIYIPPMVYGQNDSISQELADSTSTEYWRQIGYFEGQNGNDEASLNAYLMIIRMNRNDWDANLAVARLYFRSENYEESIRYYNVISENDSSDVEALWGIGRCLFRKGQFSESVIFFKKADHYLQNHIPILEDLGNALTNDNKLKEATGVFRKIITLDSVNANAWGTTGKLFYWMGQPHKAKKYYERALLLDPDNVIFQQQFHNVQKELALSLNYQLHYINENEPVSMGSDTLAYNINAVVQRLLISKRVHDLFFITISTLFDHSAREYAWQNNETRWFDNSYVSGMLISGNHKVSLHAGYSFSDSLITTYGLNWNYVKRIRSFKLTSMMAFGYEYYYYWNRVGHDYASENLRLEYKNFILEGVYRYVNVRQLYLLDLDSIARNPGHLFSISGRYNFFKNPKISAGIYYQYRDYQYRSPFYWSPQNRKLLGINAGIYWKISDRIYMYYYGNIGKDNYEIQHWEASGELGYSHKNFSFSAGIYRFYNPWYESLNANISVTRRFTAK
jgi:tetratricopeptide (TPR) repeat protein